MIRVFIDFDGTITRQDVGDAMFERFGGKRCAEYITQYRDGKISAVECFRLECEACGEAEKIELDEFLDLQAIDTSFKGFVKFCGSHGLDCVIVSDGMDYYIRRILNNIGVGGIRFLSNTLHLLPVANPTMVRFEPSFPYTDETCDRCACCKRNHLLTISADDDLIVYIGEGYSDRCPARYADAVFARDELGKFCQQEKIPFYEYATFDDVRLKMQQLLDGDGKRKIKRGLRKRRQAELARREVFMGG